MPKGEGEGSARSLPQTSPILCLLTHLSVASLSSPRSYISGSR